ncbi:MAG: histidine phosphatase family protein [Motiliproteus sp.]
MIELLTLRHAATSWNADKRLQGRRDIPLSQVGFDSLAGVSVPAQLQPRRWYCSPLQRCRQTAATLGLTSVELSDDWIEMDWGQWEGQRITELRIASPQLLQQQEQRGLDMTPTGGESPRQVRQRVMRWLQQHSEQRAEQQSGLSGATTALPSGVGDRDKIGVVCHKGVIRALLSQALDWNMTGKCPVKVDWRQGLLFGWSQQQGLTLIDYNLPLARNDQ